MKKGKKDRFRNGSRSNRTLLKHKEDYNDEVLETSNNSMEDPFAVIDANDDEFLDECEAEVNYSSFEDETLISNQDKNSDNDYDDDFTFGAEFNYGPQDDWYYNI